MKYPLMQRWAGSPSGRSSSHAISKRAFVETRDTIGPRVADVTVIAGKRRPSAALSHSGDIASSRVSGTGTEEDFSMKASSRLSKAVSQNELLYLAG